MEWKKIRDGVYQKAFTCDGATLAMHKLEPQHEEEDEVALEDENDHILDSNGQFVKDGVYVMARKVKRGIDRWVRSGRRQASDIAFCLQDLESVWTALATR